MLYTQQMNKIVGGFCLFVLIMCIVSLGQFAYADSLLGNGISLKIQGTSASGTLVLNGKYYTAPSLTISTKAGLIQLLGNIGGSSQAYLMTTGVHTQGMAYQFNGMLQQNGKSTPVSFIASLTSDVKTNPGQPPNTTKQPSTTPAQSTSTTKQASTLPMLMLPVQPSRVYVEHFYNIAVKVFDPKTNPSKSFDQFTGGISGVTINVILLDQNNQLYGKLSGKTDNKGLYQDQLYMQYSAPKQQQMKVIINATKTGYAPQQTIASFQLVHVNQY